MVLTGFRAVIGSWKIMPISPPRTEHISRSDSEKSSFPPSVADPLRIEPGGRRPMIDKAVMDFPEPDSPTTPKVIPGSISSDTPLSTSTPPIATSRSLTESSTISARA